MVWDHPESKKMKVDHHCDGSVLAGKLCPSSATAEEFLDVGQFEADRSTNSVVRNLPLLLPCPERSRGDREQSANLTRLEQPSFRQFIVTQVHSTSMREDSAGRIFELMADSLVFMQPIIVHCLPSIAPARAQLLRAPPDRS